MWEDILKRRPLRINTSQPSFEKIMVIKNKISKLVNDVTIIQLYLGDSESFSNDHHPKKLDRLEEALSDEDGDYYDQAARLTRSTTDLLFSDETSLRNVLYDLSNRLLRILRYKGRYLSKKDTHIVEQIVEEIDNIHRMYNEYLGEQERQWRRRG
jgi:hypothetical protein|tara:strand:+ start:272 stop:736 length:465 start_codon:yes stop_codon:yes gene_type:complete